MSKIPAIICDLDGTLCLFYDENGNAMRKPFYTEDCDCHYYSKDRVNKVVVDILHRFANTHYIIFCSGRTDNNYDVSIKWINDNTRLNEFDLFMRKKGDYRKDDIIKNEIYIYEIEPIYNVFFVLDDRNSVVDMWRELGLTCLQVAPGNF